jgi:hypothetical protein
VQVTRLGCGRRLCRACSGSVLAALCRACMTLHPVLRDPCVAQGGTAATTAQQMRTRHGTELDLSSNYVRAERSVPQPEHAREGSSPRVAAPKNQSSRTGKADLKSHEAVLRLDWDWPFKFVMPVANPAPGGCFSLPATQRRGPGQVAHWQSRVRAKFREACQWAMPAGAGGWQSRRTSESQRPQASAVK